MSAVTSYLPPVSAGAWSTILLILHISCRSTFHQLGCWSSAVWLKLSWSPSTALSAGYDILGEVQVLLCVAGLFKATLLKPVKETYCYNNFFLEMTVCSTR